MDLFTISQSRGKNGKIAGDRLQAYEHKCFGWNGGKHEGKTFQESISECFRRSDMTKEFRKNYGKK